MVKLTKLQFSFSLIIILILLCAVGYVSYSLTRHSASLQIKEATPKQLAEAMQGDYFYANYPQTMLLVKGKVASVVKQHTNTVVAFITTTKPSALQNVTCEFGNIVSLKKGDTIRILTVAYNAKRVNTTGVALQNCYLDQRFSK
jgi:hypothetical protein